MVAIGQPVQPDTAGQGVGRDFSCVSEGIALTLANQCWCLQCFEVIRAQPFGLSRRMKRVAEADQRIYRWQCIRQHAGHATTHRTSTECKPWRLPGNLADHLAPGFQQNRLAVGWPAPAIDAGFVHVRKLEALHPDAFATQLPGGELEERALHAGARPVCQHQRPAGVLGSVAQQSALRVLVKLLHLCDFRRNSERVG